MMVTKEKASLKDSAVILFSLSQNLFYGITDMGFRSPKKASLKSNEYS